MFAFVDLKVRTFDGMRTCGSYGHSAVSSTADCTDIRFRDGKPYCYWTTGTAVIKQDGTHDADRCFYWEVAYGSESLTSELPYVGISTGTLDGSGEDSTEARLAPESSDDIGFIKTYAPAGSASMPGSAIYTSIKTHVAASPPNPIDGRVCTAWKQVATLTAPDYVLPSASSIEQSMHGIYKLKGSDSCTDCELYIYDPSPRWSSSTYWKSNTVRKDGTSDVKCTTSPSLPWSSTLPSTSPLLTSSCLVKEGIVGSSNCDEGKDPTIPSGGSSGWYLFNKGKANIHGSSASTHPCRASSVAHTKLYTCVATVDPAIKTRPKNRMSLVLDYNHLHPGLCTLAPCYPPIFRIYSDNKLWIEEILVQQYTRPIPVTTNIDFYPVLRTMSTGTWVSATTNFQPSNLMFSPRTSSQNIGSNQATSTYTVNIINVNEKPSLADAVRYVNENAPTDTSATDLTGTGSPLLAIDDDLKVCPGSDPDPTSGCTQNDCKSNCQKLTYTRIDQTPCFRGTVGSPTDPCLNILDVDPCTGLILVSNPIVNEFLDFELQNTYTLNVKVIDDGIYPAPQEDTAVVTVHIKDVNEAPTVDAKTVWVDENSPLDTSFGIVTAVDQDTVLDIHGQLSFSIDSGNTLGLFKVNKEFLGHSQSTGLCSGNSAMYCRLRCPTDGIHGASRSGDGSKCAGTGLLECDLGYVNGIPNIGMSSCPFARDTVIDAGYNWGSGGAELKLATTTLLNFEVTNNYQITIKATDGGFNVDGITSGPLSGSGIVTIQVRDVNEPPFLADSLGTTYTVNEDETMNFAIGPKLVATDEDISQLITYTVVSSEHPTTPFRIDTDGQLKVNAMTPFNYETITQYTLKVRVTDNGSPPLSNLIDATVVVGILDVNEAPVLNDITLTINENVARDTLCPVPVPPLTGSPLTFVEPDTLSAQVHSFTIESGNSANMFTINAGTGQISVNQEGLDFESTPSYNLIVKVTDSGDPTLSDTATVTINLLNQNDSPVMPPTLNLAIAENVAQNFKTWKIGTSIGTYCATDQDTSDTLTFSILSGNEAGTFKVEKDASNPLCYFIMMDSTTPTDLNFEDPLKNSFSLIVQVQDNGVGTKTATSVVTIAVQNRNDPPVLEVMTASTPENAVANNIVGGSIVATDEDVDDVLTYTILSGNACGTYSPVFDIISLNSIGTVQIDGAFAPSAATGPTRPALQLQSCSTPAPTSFTLTIQVSDGAGGSSSHTLTISVTDQNDPPVFTDCPSTRKFAVTENSVDGTSVGTAAELAATDPDAGNTVSWLLLPQGNSGSAFDIVPATGQLRVANIAMMDFESSNNPFLLTVSIQATQ